MQKFQVSASVLHFSPQVADHFNKLGIGVELSAFSLPHYLSPNRLPDLLTQTTNLLSNFKGPVSMHGPFFDMNPIARDPWILEVCRKRMLQSLELADRLGARQLVFHANYIPHRAKDHDHIFVEKQLEYWPKIVRAAEDYDIRLLLENTREHSPKLLYDILTPINSPHFKACLDTGHTHCFTHSKLPLKDWVAGLGEQLAYVHLHANHGDLDEHLAYTDGNQDFTGFFEGLQALPKWPDLIIEVKTKNAFLRSLGALQRAGYLAPAYV
ncbi:sugar phosphate isomerase/epimerase [Saprospira sp. CCB-QB6]|uniref:sugar phosphate isomerase/epimerase family protein n=1 Tax=Saprospira sp. CCB-QB6 TaxID=3023936 RepID=UPI00234A05EB|nr:sugar phosphate isomerase/epimerase family protein [Saprospira sp. CCB-QB6]WCL81896.1 sugar phosphate isomerase/epimerase [Saprospira sp. CCB-QB6]